MNDERLDQLAHDLDVATTSAQLAEGSILEALRIEDFDLAHKAVEEAEAACRRRASIEGEIVALHAGREDGAHR